MYRCSSGSHPEFTLLRTRSLNCLYIGHRLTYKIGSKNNLAASSLGSLIILARKILAKQPHHVFVPARGGSVLRSLSIGILYSDVRPFLHEQLHYFLVPVPRRPVQRRPSLGIRRPEVRPFVQ